MDGGELKIDHLITKDKPAKLKIGPLDVWIGDEKASCYGAAFDLVCCECKLVHNVVVLVDGDEITVCMVRDVEATRRARDALKAGDDDDLAG